MDNKRLILFVVFSFALFMLWEAWNRHQQGPVPAPQAVSQNTDGADLPVPRVVGAAETPAAPASASDDYAERAKVVVRTDLIQAEVSTLGGDITRLELLRHKATGDTSQNFVLLEFRGKHTYLVQSGLLGEGLPNHKTVYSVPAGEYVLADGQDSLELRLEAPVVEGLKVTKVLGFKRGSYEINQRYEIENTSEAPFARHAYFQLVRDGEAAENTAGFFGGAQTFTGPGFYTQAEKYRKLSFSDIDDGKPELPKAAKDGWVAMVQHYFVTGLLPQAGLDREFFARKVGDKLYAAGLIVPVSVAPGAKAQVEVPLYAGPQEQDKLKTLAPGFDVVVDYGWLTVIAVPIFWALQLIHGVVGNWGWAIILLTILIKLAFFPLSAASYRSMAKMRGLMPRLKRLQEQYSDDRMKLNQEMMALYKREKVNPMGGCLPIVVQIPVFIALYWVLLASVEMRQAPWLGWITDLSVKDPYFVLPIIMGISMLVQTKLNPTPPDPMQAKVMMFMPIIFTVMFLWFPAGLVLYWVVNNLLSIAQQWYITKQVEGGASPS